MCGFDQISISGSEFKASNNLILWDRIAPLFSELSRRARDRSFRLLWRVRSVTSYARPCAAQNLRKILVVLIRSLNVSLAVVDLGKFLDLFAIDRDSPIVCRCATNLQVFVAFW